MNYKGKHILVLGLGESGLAIARWLVRGEAILRVADTRAEPARLGDLLVAVPDAEFVSGAFEASLLDGIDIVAVSPGLSPLAELAELLPAAQERGLPVWGEIELFAQALAELRDTRGYAPRVIAVTGTNGKTTVTSLTGLLCRRAGMTTAVAGNISPAVLDVLCNALDADALPQVWVLELSSFQLHWTSSLQADAATVLNLSQDHLDWHGDMDAYAADKARIFGQNTVRILNRDDQRVLNMQTLTGSNVLFGAGRPEQPGSLGLVEENGMAWLALAEAGEEEGKRRRRKDEAALPVLVKRLMPADALPLRGRHNATNALAAIALCRAVGLPLAPLLHGLREYQGEPHRVELVATVSGVEYYDDSKGTNVGATVAALQGLGAERPNARLILIAGGDGKGQDFTPLAQPVARYARHVILIGHDAPRIRAALAETGVELLECASLEAAVCEAAAAARPGDAVLLSPACASFDMFRNYVHRAEVFVEAVRELALSRGEVLA